MTMNTIDDLTDDQKVAIFLFLDARQRMKTFRWQALFATLVIGGSSYLIPLMSRDVQHMPFMSAAPAIMEWLALACCGLFLVGLLTMQAVVVSYKRGLTRVGLPEGLVYALAVMPLNGLSRHRLS